MKEIRGILEKDDATLNIEEIEAEVRTLNERKTELEAAAEKRKGLLDEVNKFGTTIRSFKETKDEFTPDSDVYKRAWLKNLAIDATGRKLFGEMTEIEKRAFTFVTTNTPQVVPTEIMNRVITLIDNDSPIYDDSFETDMVYGFEIPRLKSITAGDAKNVTEGTANDDEQDAFDLIALPGVEIKKHIVMSRKMPVSYTHLKAGG